MPEIRCFIAIALPDEAKQTITAIQSRVRAQKIHGSYPRPGSFHLTLKFLGSTERSCLVPVQKALEQAVAETAPFCLSAGSLGVFPGVKKARVIWAGIGLETDQLSGLVDRLGVRLDALGFPREKKRYLPHITLVRVKQQVPPRQMVGLIQTCSTICSAPFEVTRIHLYKSDLHANGAVHTCLSTHSFKRPRT